jgi:NADH-quinone oxidoreductase subunit C
MAMDQTEILNGLRAAFPADVLDAVPSPDDPAAVIRPAALPSVMAWLRDGPPRMTLLLDITCVDRPERAERFELVYHVLSLTTNARLRLKASVPDAGPEVASLSGLWKNAAWLEREIFDLFGVRFSGHPDLRRLLLYDGFEGHPLRKDYPLRLRQPRIPLRKPEGGR